MTTQTPSCCIVTAAKGELHNKLRQNLTASIIQIRPTIPFIHLDNIEIPQLTEIVPEEFQLLFRRFIPLFFPQGLFAFDRIIYLDNDMEVLSPRFFEILKEPTSADGIACVHDLDWQKRRNNLIIRYSLSSLKNFAYFNAGLIVYEQKKINQNAMIPSLLGAIKKWKKTKKPYMKDQDVLNMAFHISALPSRYSWFASQQLTPQTEAFLIHYAGRRSKKILLDKLGL